MHDMLFPANPSLSSNGKLMEERDRPAGVSVGTSSIPSGNIRAVFSGEAQQYPISEPGGKSIPVIAAPPSIP